MEGPLRLENCLYGTPVCGRDSCALGDLLPSINRQVLASLERRLSET